MKEPFSSQPHRSGELARAQEHSVELIQHQQDSAQLEQQINHIISNSSDSEAVLQQIAQTLGEAFRVDYCLVMVAADEQVAGQILYCYVDKHLVVPPQYQILGRQLASVMGASSEPVVIDDIQAIETSLLREWRHLPLPVRSILEVPTWFQGKINGVISLIRTQPYPWSESEKKCAFSVVASVAIAISQVVQTRLIASLQQQVHTRAQYQSLIDQLTMASHRSLDLNQILKLAITGTVQTLQVERGLLLMLKYADPLFKTRKKRETFPKAKATVVCEWFSGYDSGVVESPDAADYNASTVLNQSFSISECLLCQQAFTNSPSPVVITDQHDLPAIDPVKDIAPLFNITSLPALVIFALESGGSVLGFLVLQHSCTRLWHSEELALLKLVSAQVSTAIIQSQRLRQVQSLVEERTAQLQGSLEVQARLYEKTRQQIDQLRQLNHLKDEFIDSLSHELKTPLTKMKLAICMLRQPGLRSERHAQYLEILEQQCTQEINLITDLLKLQELESHQATLNLQTIHLKPFIQNLAQSFEEKWADKGLTITVNLPKASLLLQTDTDSLERILHELFTNAGKYSEPDTTVVLRATYEVNQIIFTLTNFGTGISPEDTIHIFDKFRRGQGVTQQAIQGTGLGLALVKCLVQHLNGTIQASSSPSDHSSSCETCFTLTLPQFLDQAKP